MRFLIFEQKNDCSKYQFHKLSLIDYSYELESFLEKFYLYDYDLILLNISRIEARHLELIQEIKSENKKVPILCCMEKIDDLLINKIFNSGISNFLFNHTQGNFYKNDLIIGSLSFSFINNSFFISNQELILRKKEFLLLKFLVLNQNKFVSKRKIISRLINDIYDKDSNLVEVYIYRLRKILREKEANVKIISKRNYGYKISTC